MIEIIGRTVKFLLVNSLVDFPTTYLVFHFGGFLIGCG